MKMPYFMSHRLIYSSFSPEDALRIQEKLKATDIPFLVKKKQASLTDTFGQLADRQIAYDIYVPNDMFDRAKHVLNLL